MKVGTRGRFGSHGFFMVWIAVQHFASLFFTVFGAAILIGSRKTGLFSL